MIVTSEYESKPVYVEHFDNMTDLINTVRGRPPRNSYQDYIGSDMDICSSSWSGFEDSATMRHSMTYGRAPKSALANIGKLKQDIAKKADEKKRTEIQPAPFGCLLNVPRYSAGNDFCMMLKRPTKTEPKRMRIGIDCGVLSHVQQCNITKGTDAIMRVLMKLDAEGYELALSAVKTSLMDVPHAIFAFDVKIKDYKDKLDVSRLYNIIGTRAFTRCLAFGVWTRHPQYAGDVGGTLVNRLGRERYEKFAKDYLNYDRVIAMGMLADELSGCTDDELDDYILSVIKS